MMELKKSVVGGVAWSIGGSFIIQIINLIIKIIVARLLFPSDFGLFAMAFTLINFLNLFMGFGINSAVIFKKDDHEKTLNTAFVLTFLFGLCLSVLSYILSDFVAQFFNQPDLGTMIKVLSIVFVFDSINSLLYAVLLKAFQFQRKIIIDVCSTIVYGVSTITCAYLGYGVWSLVFGYLIQHSLLFLFLWKATPKKPGFMFEIPIAKEILHFGKYVLATSFLAWAITSIDNIVVGKYLGDISLGYYSFAFMIASIPVLGFTHILSSVFHPVYAKLQDDQIRLRQAYLKPLELALLIMFPLFIGFFLLADILIGTILGEKWLPIVLLLRVFSIYCVFRTVCAIISQFLEGTGRPRTATLLLLTEFILVIILLIPLMNIYGLLGVAVAITLARGASMVFHLYSINNMLSMNMKDYRIITKNKIYATLLMGIVVYGFRLILTEETLITLIILVGVGAVVYILTLLFLEPKLYEETKDVLGMLK